MPTAFPSAMVTISLVYQDRSWYTHTPQQSEPSNSYALLGMINAATINPLSPHSKYAYKYSPPSGNHIFKSGKCHVVCHGHRLLVWPALQASRYQSVVVWSRSWMASPLARAGDVRVGKGKAYNRVCVCVCVCVLQMNLQQNTNIISRLFWWVFTLLCETQFVLICP